MVALADQIDRLARNTRNIKTTAATIAAGDASNSVAGPFTRAMLTTELGDLIRDIDPSELGLFNLVAPPNAAAVDRDMQSATAPEITRVEFHGATPLRRPPPKRDELQKTKEVEPEVYAQAALKYIDRYQPIRPMPRAYSQVSAILEQVEIVRENIQTLNETLQRIQISEQPSLKTLADEEERRVEGIQARLAQLRKRKESVSTQPRAKTSRLKPIPTSDSNPDSKPTLGTPVASSSRTKATGEEDKFWATPARTLHFTDNLLMNEQADFADESMVSIPSPSSSRRPPAKSQTLKDSDPVPSLDAAESGKDHDTNVGDEDEPEAEGESTEVVDEEKTIMLPKHSLPPIEPDAVKDEEEKTTPEPQTPGKNGAETPGTKKRLKVNMEVERIVAKIWATMGDSIMPGHSFDTSGTGSNKPPRAKETLNHLQSLSSLTPTPQSPAYSSSNTSQSNVAQPTPQQILTAHLLISLISAAPHFSMPLNNVKTLLAQKAGTSGPNGVIGGQGTLKALYACVAKKLLRIDRGGGEQVVKFI